MTDIIKDGINTYEKRPHGWVDAGGNEVIINKTVVAVCVYNRIENIRLWVKCWQQCDRGGARLVIIHNHYGDQELQEQMKEVCGSVAEYIPRNGTGFDIGAMKDVFTGVIQLQYDRLLWCCDDTFPMSKDFIQQFTNAMQPGVGIACMQISKSVSHHVRTTGFMISRAVAEQIRFPAEVKTKQDCYFFEHRGGKLTLTEQVRAMGLSCVMVSDIKTSPLWDSFHPNVRHRLNRLEEFNKTWGIPEPGNKILFICPVYNMYPQIISSLICQTHQNWELLLIHNGPLNDYHYDIPKDPRIKFIVHPIATGKWGHELRKMALKKMTGDADYVTITNADNYHSPVYCEYMLKGFKINPNAVASYCSDMTHSYKAWQVIPCSLKLGYIDCAGVMVRSDVASSIGWRDTDSHSSDWTYFSDIIKKHGVGSFQKVTGNLFVHN